MFNRASTKTMSFEDIAYQAFAKQTLQGGKYAKADVKTSYEAFKTYLNEKTPEHLDTFRTTVATCVENNRAQFDLLQKVLDKVSIDNISVAKFRIK